MTEGNRSWPRRVLGAVLALARRSVATVVLVVLVLVGLRAWHSTQGPPLRPWHTIVPAELDSDAIVHGDWNAWMAAESRLFDRLHRDLQREMEPADRTPINRYEDGSFASPLAFDREWNRSYILDPAITPRGVAVLLHGLSDSPYSMRSLAALYRANGFIAIVPRMPGHGTVPGALTHEGRKEWEATVEMTMVEARRRTGGRLPLHLVGYSNGGALGLLHVARRIAAGERNDVQRIVLLSPMIEVNTFARYAGLAGLPAYFGRYAKTAWLDLLPEYNPFKYNSFPVRAARESYLVTSDLQGAMDAVAQRGAMDKLPPILAFQSVVDDTVTAPAVMTRLFDRLPANGSELVLFDVHRGRMLDPILRPGVTAWTHEALKVSRRYTFTVIGTASEDDATAVARSRPANADGVRTRGIGARYPEDIYSLSHIALPFPADDPLYGRDPSGRRVIQLGRIAVRGERNTLAVSQDSLDRLTWNPFYDEMRKRIEETLPP
ncbi:putative membrane protein [Lysobacter dokdonensis DS-58]|uniref:Putative membrane protein n=1 Tax=Lysobacter dokdonensis DS-58 TaxID=1300345 RepID=A0A0A2WJ62_9GAMM|nr:alpha/beta fold hydrolase [Lysobacter dokdonensis]KGQ18747.1 putative membrane protein [Lysobacter dokdonensis DS-58]